MQADLRLRRMRDPGFTPSVPIPDMRTSAGGLAVTMGVFTNVRFQVVGGIDRYLFDHSNYLFSYLALSTAFRAASTWIGQPTRLHLQARRRCVSSCARCTRGCCMVDGERLWSCAWCE